MPSPLRGNEMPGVACSVPIGLGGVSSAATRGAASPTAVAGGDATLGVDVWTSGKRYAGVGSPAGRSEFSALWVLLPSPAGGALPLAASAALLASARRYERRSSSSPDPAFDCPTAAAVNPAQAAAVNVARRASCIEIAIAVGRKVVIVRERIKERGLGRTPQIGRSDAQGRRLIEFRNFLDQIS